MSTNTKIVVIDLDRDGNLHVNESPTMPITLPVVDGVIADRITIRPDWPALNDPRFDAKLRAWYVAHNQ